jgi:geranylgeranyl diphosphate synthase, type II
MPAIDQYLERQRERTNKALESALDRAGDIPEQLRQAMHYGLLAPGKRLRPALVLMSAEAAGGDEAAAMPAACAVEMIHAYSLVHDDLPSMDDDDLRRGLPTCHKKFGEATAILAGDALLTLAFQTLAEGFPPRTATACCGELARAAGAAGMVGGQALDLVWEQRGGASMGDLEQVHGRKTGALFGSCMRLGLISAQGERPTGLDPLLLKAFDDYGIYFGQAFQITDDILDCTSSALQSGKRVGKDASRGKLTYPTMLGLEESRERAKSLCNRARMALEPLGPRGAQLRALLETLIDRKQ